MTKDSDPINYSSSGVNYEILDSFKRLAQSKALETSKNLVALSLREQMASRGEAAYVWEEKDAFRALVVEGLGTKNLVADRMRAVSHRSFYDVIAQDTVATIVNDLVVVGAVPQFINAYFAVGSSEWFLDEERTNDLVCGWAKACNLAGAVWGGGETPTLKGIIHPDTIDLAGSAIGIISPKERLTLGKGIKAGDAIFMVESSGIHANGLSLAQALAETLPDGFRTMLPDGKNFGESLLTPTHIYSNLVKDFFDAGIDIHYMVNITGHGWRKLMRANREFTYIIDKVPEPLPIFDFIQKYSGNDDYEMYGTFNMGAGFAVIMPERFTSLAKKITLEKHGWSGERVGMVKYGRESVRILPKNIIYKADSLRVR